MMMHMLLLLLIVLIQKSYICIQQKISMVMVIIIMLSLSKKSNQIVIILYISREYYSCNIDYDLHICVYSYYVNHCVFWKMSIISYQKSSLWYNNFKSKLENLFQAWLSLPLPIYVILLKNICCMWPLFQYFKICICLTLKNNILKFAFVWP